MLGLWSVFLSKSTSYLSLCLSLIFLMQWDIKYLSIIKSWNQVWSLLGDHGLYPGLNPRHVGSSSYMSYKVSLLFLGSQIFFPVFLIHLFHVSFLTILHWMLNFFIFIFLTEKKNYFSHKFSIFNALHSFFYIQVLSDIVYLQFEELFYYFFSYRFFL